MKTLVIILLLSTSALAVSPKSLDATIATTTLQVRAAFEQLHRHPEVGMKEVETARFVRAELERIGYTTFYDVKGLPTAVVAILETGRPGPVTGLRADLDALPVTEAAGHAVTSQTPGRMHACGHDAHTASLLGAAQVLLAMKAELNGKIVLLFQPAEEVAGGADDIVEAGVLKDLGITRLFGQHVRPGLPVGSIGLSVGPIMAGSTTLKILLTGEGGHAARPWETDDVLLHAAELVTDLSALPARELDVANRPCIISLTSFHSGRATNVLPDSAEIGGTIRSFENIDTPFGSRPAVKTVIEEFVKRQTQADGLTAVCRFIPGAPPLVNDTALYNEIVPRLTSDWPEGRVGPALRTTAAEDFAFYTAECPCLFISLGIAKGELGREGVHQPGFTVHPDALPYGVRALVMMALYSNAKTLKN